MNKLVFLAAFLSFSADTNNYNKAYTNNIVYESLNKKVEYLQQEVACYEGLINKKEETFKKKSHKTKREKMINSQYKSFIPYSRRVNMKISPELRLALSSCTFTGQCRVTSAFRPWSSKSLHSKGRAIDIEWNSEGKYLLTWLETTEGSSWLKNNNLDFYLENIYEMRNHAKYFYNKKASGPHIHLWIE